MLFHVHSILIGTYLRRVADGMHLLGKDRVVYPCVEQNGRSTP